jgi:hypothetical protein
MEPNVCDMFCPRNKTGYGAMQKQFLLYEGRVKSSWIHLIPPSRNFVELR